MARPPLLFVHGLCHGAWCWTEHFVPYFAEQGYEVRAIDLRGHGARRAGVRLRFVPLERYVDDVAEAVAEAGRAPVLVGHSMGGAIVQKAVARGVPAAGLVLVASVPHSGAWGATARYAAAHPLRFLAINGTLSFRPMVGTPEAFASFFSPRFPRPELERLQRNLQDESYRAFVDMLLMAGARPRPSGLPTLVVAAAEDSLFSPAAERRLARHHDAQFELFQGMGHDMMLETGWEAVAERIGRFLAQLPEPAAA